MSKVCGPANKDNGLDAIHWQIAESVNYRTDILIQRQ